MQTVELFGADSVNNVCKRCGDSYLGNGFDVGTDTVCSVCFSNYQNCRACDEPTHLDDIGGTVRSGAILCESCADGGDYAYCDRCGTHVMSRAYDEQWSACVSYCLPDIATGCINCGDMTDNDYLNYNRHGEPLCEWCYEDDRPDYVHSYHAGHPMGLRFHGGMGDIWGTFFGVEFEMEGILQDTDVLQTAQEMHDAHAEEDSSVEGIEFISQPATLEAWRGEYGERMRNYLGELNRQGLTGSAVECGAHIHVSRSAFTDRAHLARFSVWFIHNADMVESLSGRESGLEQWASLKPYDRGELSRSMRYGGDRYRAVNLRNLNTVEVRVFAGTDDFDVTTARIEFLAALVEYTRDLHTSDVMLGALLMDSFAAWLSDDDQATRYARAGAWIASALDI